VQASPSDDAARCTVNRPLEPLQLEPVEKEAIWGGDALALRYGKPADPQATTGESWECWDDNRVASGPYAGWTLARLRAELGSALMGYVDPGRIFPLLTKLIDARHSLSVQVHPDDAYARRVEGQGNGKTECWYILEADPDANIVLGWNRDTTRGEYLERVRDGSLGELLRRVPVRSGDAFHLPAGTLHAIGGGIVLYEVQQASDLTYRIFDYNRLGPDGKPRALHVERAADVLDYHHSSAGALRSLRYVLDGLPRTTLVADRRFAVERVELEGTRHGYDLEGGPLVVLALETPVELEAHGHGVRLEPYQTGLIPAALDVVMLRALEAERATLLTAAPLRDGEQLPRRYSRAAVDIGASTDFLAQF
jgi:mannose-6-phosphate isomerase